MCSQDHFIIISPFHLSDVVTSPSVCAVFLHLYIPRNGFQPEDKQQPFMWLYSNTELCRHICFWPILYIYIHVPSTRRLWTAERNHTIDLCRTFKELSIHKRYFTSVFTWLFTKWTKDCGIKFLSALKYQIEWLHLPHINETVTVPCRSHTSERNIWANPMMKQPVFFFYLCRIR